MKTANKATILGVGTELTTGQIVNQNGSWISEKLIPFGIETVSHLVVPDDRAQILRALDYCAENSDLIFVTGGLGPTSDDFTRDLISQWSKRELKFDEASWTHVETRLQSRGYVAQEIQKQQCYFPEGATILPNSQGTANGFQLKVESVKGKKEVFVLPGPPREIEAVWNTTISKWLFVNTQLIDKKITKSWDTIGIGESDVALKVEKCFEKKWPDLKYDLGYRVHHPYVEVKFSYFKSQENFAKSIIEQINSAIDPITVLKNFADITEAFAKITQNADFAFYDFVSEGFLHHRLSKQLRKYKNWMWKESTTPLDSDFFSDEKNFLALFPLDENFEKVILMAEFNGQNLSLEITAPMKSPNVSDRRKQYFAEIAMVEFVKRLS